MVIYWNNKVMSAWRLCLPVLNVWTHFIHFLHYKLISFRNVMHLNEVHLITSRAADNSENTSTLKIKSHNINSLCVFHSSEQFKHIKTSLSKLSSKMLCMLAVCVAFTTTNINLSILWRHKTSAKSVGEDTQKIRFWSSILIFNRVGQIWISFSSSQAF